MLGPPWRQPQTRSSACDRATGVDAAFVRLVLRYQCRCFGLRYRAIGQPFGSCPLGISLCCAERCAKKRGDSSCESSEEWCVRPHTCQNLALAHKHTSFIDASACKKSCCAARKLVVVPQQLCHSTDSQHRYDLESLPVRGALKLQHPA